MYVRWHLKVWLVEPCKVLHLNIGVGGTSEEKEQLKSKDSVGVKTSDTYGYEDI